MNWVVEGASAESGEELAVTLEADDAGQAERRGRRRGLLVSSVRPLETNSEPDQQSVVEGEDPAVEPDDSIELPPSQMDYATPVAADPYRATDEVPNYTGLQIGSNVLRILGLLCYLLGAITILFGIFALAMGSTGGFSGGAGGMIAMVMAFVGSLSPLIAGAILHMLGSAGVALRDIARNSFR